MTGPQTEIEIRLWRDEFSRMRQTPEWTDAAMDAADDLLHRYRARYGLPQPAAPPATWYDEPPCPKDGSVSPVWLFDYPLPILVAYFDGWMYEVPGVSNRWHHLAGRRVSPIVTPPEPPQ